MRSRDLPIYEIEQELLDALLDPPRAVLSAPTGSGKSTQVPQMLLDAGMLGDGQVVVLQPRRLAARLLARRVAEERGGAPGGEVGYQVRFENVTGPETRIRYITEAILLRQMIGSPALDGVAAVVFDEFHERHLYGDLTLARVRDLQRSARPDLRIIVMSATLDQGLLERYLDPCTLISSEGRVFPVDIQHLDRRVDFRHQPVWEVAADAFARTVREGAEGDVLIFMPGAYEIRRTVETILAGKASRDWVVLPLHGELPPGEQDAAVGRQERRKVIVATNVAETSITIDGIRVVIDSGLARVARFDQHRGINTLFVENISRASADQRAGRAGRTATGVCLRLWTRHEHEGRAVHDTPEIRRVDIAEAVLALKGCGVEDLNAFRWVEPPDPKALTRAVQTLTDLGAIDESRGGREDTGRDARATSKTVKKADALTPLGRRMLAFPVHPRYARMLIAGDAFGCVRQAALIAALTQGRGLMVRGGGRQVEQAREILTSGEENSDLLIRMRMWSYAKRCDFQTSPCRKMGIHAATARQVGPLLDHFLRIARKEGLSINEKPPDDDAIARCVLTAFIDHLAVRRDRGTRRCDLIHGRRGELDRDSVVQDADLLVAVEVNEIESSHGDTRVRLGLAVAVEEAWLHELYPEAFRETDEVDFDATGKRVTARRVKRFLDLELSSSQLRETPAGQAAELLAAEVMAGRFTLKKWDHRVEQWICRVNSLARWCPELEIPELTEADRLLLVQQICLGSFSYKEIKEKEVRPALRTWLSPEQQSALDHYAPERFVLPGGRRIKVTYPEDHRPYIAARIQELYGVTQPLTIAMGRVNLLIHVLAPNHRPVQVTNNLADFWSNTYPAVKKEMQRRYPRHEWR